jgi:hypothetical protein
MAILSHEPNGLISQPGARRQAVQAAGNYARDASCYTNVTWARGGLGRSIAGLGFRRPEVRSEMTTNEAGMCLTPKELRI